MLRFVLTHYTYHLVPVWIIALPVAWARQEIFVLLLSSCFAVLIDSDHFVDYLLFPNRRGFSLREALGCSYFLRAPRIYLLLHAYDLHLTVAAFLFWHGHLSFASAWAIGFIVHIITDQLLGHSKGDDPLRNVLIYRLANGFDRRLYEESS